jgi:hypothetical protein
MFCVPTRLAHIATGTPVTEDVTAEYHSAVIDISQAVTILDEPYPMDSMLIDEPKGPQFGV